MALACHQLRALGRGSRGRRIKKWGTPLLAPCKVKLSGDSGFGEIGSRYTI